MSTMRRPLTGDPFGIEAAQAALDAAIRDRDDAICELVKHGATHRECAEVFGLTAARITQIVGAARQRAWGEVHVGTMRGLDTHAEARRNMLDAIHAQDLRAEAASGGNRTELRAFYGHADESQADSAERRLTLAQARAEHAAKLAHEREQAEAYRARKARRKSA